MNQSLYPTKASLWIITIVLFSGIHQLTFAQSEQFNYTVSVSDPASHQYHVQLRTSGWNQDTLLFKMPEWMPGYYQIMNYADDIDNLSFKSPTGEAIFSTKLSDNTWQITGAGNMSFVIEYDITTHRQFVANSYVDSSHAYIIPENTFLYVDGFLDAPVSVTIKSYVNWPDIATGLDMVEGKSDQFKAPNFDILYDCPILLGQLEQLPTFNIQGIEHVFTGYSLGEFDKDEFIKKLKAVTEAAVAITGDIPYNRYTFIAIGPGRGGIEHLNNTTVSFDGSQLKDEKSYNKMLNFLAHEFFHNYNVKRIRPFELGPFDYEKGSKTNLLWVSEGLSVYYEYMIVKRAGLINDSTLFNDFEDNINTYENNPGRQYQSLVQASYNTWHDGPFGSQGKDEKKAISYYQKGPIVGLLLDFAIRNATQNKKSLDNVMKELYWKYYKTKHRGFTDAEFQQTCEKVAQKSLTSLFEYVYTTKNIDYNTYLNMAGLKLEERPLKNSDRKKYKISYLTNPDPLQLSIQKSWLGDKK